MQLKRKKWEEIAKTLLGAQGTIKYAGSNIPCTIKEIIITNNKNNKPELLIEASNGKRYPIKRFTQSKNLKEEAIILTSIPSYQNLSNIIQDGKGKLISQGNFGKNIYEVRTSSSTSPIIVVFDEHKKSVIKII